MVDKPTDMTKPDPRAHLEALAHLAGGSPVHYVRCTDCANWSGKCDQGRPATLPEFRIHICGLYEPKSRQECRQMRFIDPRRRMTSGARYGKE